VHGGEARGRRLRSPRGIRPTQGLVKEAIFNILGETVIDAVVIDLFAGSGALGIEALSRGAERVTFVERDDRCASILRQNLDALAYADRARTVRGEAVRWLRANAAEVASADVILLDPPYGDDVFLSTLTALDELAGDTTIIVAEHAAGAELPALPRLRVERSRRYGDTELTLLRAR
jgi:16S rRNA (guanine(966)-N(2))-methyltransferase RsmD